MIGGVSEGSGRTDAVVGDETEGGGDVAQATRSRGRVRRRGVGSGGMKAVASMMEMSGMSAVVEVENTSARAVT